MSTPWVGSNHYHSSQQLNTAIICRSGLFVFSNTTYHPRQLIAGQMNEFTRLSLQRHPLIQPNLYSTLIVILYSFAQVSSQCRSPPYFRGIFPPSYYLKDDQLSPGNNVHQRSNSTNKPHTQIVSYPLKNVVFSCSCSLQVALMHSLQNIPF